MLSRVTPGVITENEMKSRPLIGKIVDLLLRHHHGHRRLGAVDLRRRSDDLNLLLDRGHAERKREFDLTAKLERDVLLDLGGEPCQLGSHNIKPWAQGRNHEATEGIGDARTRLIRFPARRSPRAGGTLVTRHRRPR